MTKNRRNTYSPWHSFPGRKSIGIFCLVLFFVFSLKTASDCQPPPVLASSGGTAKDSSSGSMDFTLGELAFSYLNNGVLDVSFGIQQPLAPDTLPKVDSLKCGMYVLDSVSRPVENERYQNTLRLPYVKGNGNRFDTTRFSSQGVTGLTLLLLPGKLAKGDSVLVFSISGIPSKEGVAIFTIDFGKATCQLAIDVGPQSPKVDSLICSKAILSPEKIYAKLSFIGTLQVPYTGGNAKVAPAATFKSEGVTGLQATSTVDTLKRSGGTLKLRLEGTPDAIGTVRLPIAYGGKTCIVELAVEEFPLTIPNFFSPNADGANDLWEIPNFQILYPNGVVVIMDRNGRKLVEFNGNFNGWDGTINGKNALPGVYWYYIRLEAGKETPKGNLTLIR